MDFLRVIEAIEVIDSLYCLERSGEDRIPFALQDARPPR
jgi:hypothetical protein